VTPIKGGGREEGKTTERDLGDDDPCILNDVQQKGGIGRIKKNNQREGGITFKGREAKQENQLRKRPSGK